MLKRLTYFCTPQGEIKGHLNSMLVQPDQALNVSALLSQVLFARFCLQGERHLLHICMCITSCHAFDTSFADRPAEDGTPRNLDKDIVRL